MIYSYHIASFCLLLILTCFHWFRRHLSLLKNRLFFWFLTGMTLASVSGLVLALFLRDYEKIGCVPTEIAMLVTCAAVFASPILFAAYTVSWTGQRTVGKLPVFSLVFLPVGGLVALLALSPFTEVLVRRSGGIPKPGYGRFILLGLAILAIGYAVFFLLRRDSIVELREKLTLIAVSLAVIAALIVQAVNPKTVSLVLFLVSITVLLYDLLIENNHGRTDPRTGMFDQASLLWVLSVLYAGKRPFQVLGISPDELRFICETFGSETEEQLLRRIGRALQSGSRDQPYIVGRDQIYLLFRCDRRRRKTPEDAVSAVMELLARPWELPGGKTVHILPRAFLLRAPDDCPTLGELRKNMELGLQAAEKKPGGTVLRATDESLAQVRFAREVAQILKTATEKRQFTVFYQPIWSAESNAYTEAEALVRLSDPRYVNTVTPNLFIPEAERTGAIHLIGNMVMDAVCRMMVERRPSGVGMSVMHINISVAQCMDPGFSSRMLATMRKWRLSPGSFCFELSESAAERSPELVRENMRTLSAEGVRFALDNYGTGNASLEYISEFRFQSVKLDKTLVQNRSGSAATRVVLTHTLSMLAELGVPSIVAEGVETEVQRDFLIAHGCRSHQGWLYAKPMTEDDFMEFLQKESLYRRDGAENTHTAAPFRP